MSAVAKIAVPAITFAGSGRIVVADIVKAVAYEMGLRPADIIAMGRCQREMRARAAVCWLARRVTDRSLVNIGVTLSGRHHTTILHAVTWAEDRRDRDPAFRMLTDRLLAEFQKLKGLNS